MCCDCSVKNGKAKKLYKVESEAKEQKEYALLTRSVKLNIYECPTKRGWHLTSNTHSYSY